MTTTTPKIFGQVKPVALINTTLLTIAPTATAQLNIFVANQSDSIDRFSIEIIPNGDSPDASRYVAYNTPVIGNGVFAMAGIGLSGGDTVQVLTANGNCSITGTGLQFGP
jgi:hypothetical protein